MSDPFQTDLPPRQGATHPAWPLVLSLEAMVLLGVAVAVVVA